MPLPRGLIFDLDGTLTRPQPQLFARLRTLLAIPPRTAILPYIATLAPAARARSLATVRRLEREAMRAAVPTPGLRPLLSYLRHHSIPAAVVTSNFIEPVRWLEREWIGGGYRFDQVVTRETEGVRLKPAGEGVLEVARRWGVPARDVWMVGDSPDDVECARRAGVGRMVLVKEGVGGEGGGVSGEAVGEEGVDWVVERLDEILPRLEAAKGEGAEGGFVRGVEMLQAGEMGGALGEART